MNIKSIATPIACLAVLAAATVLPAIPALAEGLSLRDVTMNGTWDCRDPGGTFKGTIVVAQETYAWLQTDGRLGGYGTLKILGFDTDLPTFALLSGPLKDDVGAGGGGVAGPRENFEDFSGELFLTLAVTTDRKDAWYCTGRHAPEGLV